MKPTLTTAVAVILIIFYTVAVFGLGFGMGGASTINSIIEKSADILKDEAVADKLNGYFCKYLGDAGLRQGIAQGFLEVTP